ncbi:sugar transferase [Aeromicrobium sp. Root495]|uniref:sugar transferase n=1 Tax=Aeromicrobium sp. Root495 TaxID=1736550 RepID=UPI000A8230BD|nr:sugar transferase [Aeromicrobium sp. Root495]
MHVTIARWHSAYILRLIVTDVVCLVAAVLLSSVIWFGDSRMETNGFISVNYTTFGLLLAAGWVVALHVGRTRETRIIGDGIEEYRRVVRASFVFFGWFAIASLALKIDSSRGYLAVAFPLGVVLVLLGRKSWRVFLHRRRRRGEMIANALVIGGTRSASALTGWLGGHPVAGVRVTGVWTPDSEAVFRKTLKAGDGFIPVMGTNSTLADAIDQAEAEIVIVTDTEHLGTSGLKALTWQLEAADIDLLVAPNVVDVSGSRIQLSTVARMPFLHVAKPTYEDAAAWPKTLFDKVGALMIILVAAPILLFAAAAVRFTSRGPVLYRQERIGRDGKPFGMMKFRSMRSGSDAELGELLEAQGTLAGPLAKIVDDPRITPVGRFIRRFSIDELPQLFNVLAGTMSLVGPRPQRQFEVDLYDDIASRRLRVLPGMTGLWQVSGRSDMDWEDAVQLDTYYVENWSMTGDLIILWKTIRAVVRPDGAY